MTLRRGTQNATIGIVASVAAFLSNAVLASSQEVTGTLGAPSATTTIDGRYLPNPLASFGGEIGLSAKDSKPYWQPNIVPPKGAPFDQWPVGMGLECFYGFMGGEADQHRPFLIRNTSQITPLSSNPPNVLARDFTITADIEAPADGSGMIVTNGGKFGGFGLYLVNGKPIFTYNLLSLAKFRWEGGAAVKYDGPGIGKGGTGTLSVDGQRLPCNRFCTPFRPS